MRNKHESGQAAGGFLIFVGVVILVAAVSFGVWYIGIRTAPFAGEANLHRQIYSPTNILEETTKFHTLYADVEAQTSNIQTQAAQIKSTEQGFAGQADPFGQHAQAVEQLQSALTGLEQQCQNNVQSYNQSASNEYEFPFVQNNLPTQLPDPNNPSATNCQEAS